MTHTILNQTFETVHNTAPFSKIKNEDFLPAFESAITTAKLEIQAIVENKEMPSFENTIEAMAFSGMNLERISSLFFNLHSAETNDEIEKIAQEIAPKLADFGNDITLNPELFKRVKAVYEQRETLALTKEEAMLLETTFKSFARNGALLADDAKEKLRSIDAELSVLKLKFGENILADQNAYQLHITNESDLKGLPHGAIEAAEGLAKSEGKDGWLITLDYPSLIPFLM
jgi:peptidyl-dipeptidase Dcp